MIVFEKLLLVLKKVPKGKLKYHYKGHIEVHMHLHTVYVLT